MQGTRFGIIGGGWPGVMHAKGCVAAGGCPVVAVADLIPERRSQLAAACGPNAAVHESADELLADPAVEAVIVCVPTDLHLPIGLKALKAGKHVLMETPPGVSSRDAVKLARSAEKRERVLAYAFQRRFGAAELAAQQVVEKGYLGEPQHVRASWMRTRGVPVGTGWYADPTRSGGGALLDLGLPLLDLAWALLGRPRPLSAYAVARADTPDSVETFATALLRFDGGKTLELSTSWSINQPPNQNGTTCRVLGSAGALELYTAQGPLLYRQFDAKGNSKETPLKLPKVFGHAALIRQFRECILGRTRPTVGGDEGVSLMQMIEGLYKSARTGRSVGLEQIEARLEPDQAKLFEAPAE